MITVEAEWDGKTEKFELDSPLRKHRKEYLMHIRKLEELEKSESLEDKYSFLEEFLDWKEKLTLSLVKNSTRIISVDKLDDIPTEVLNKLVKAIEERVMPNKSF